VSGGASGWHPPTYFIALKGWRIFGDSQVALRSFSVLAAVLTVPMVYLVARRLESRWVAAVAAVLLSVNAYFLQYAQEARTYALTMLLATVSYLFFLRAIEAESRGRWLAYAVVCVAGIYSHIFFSLLVAAQVLSLAVPTFRPRRFDGPLFGYGIIAALSLPLFVGSLMRSGSLLAWIKPTELSRIAAWFTDFAGGTVILAVLYGVGIALAVAWALGPGRRPGRFWVLLLWVVIPPLGLAGASLIKPVFLSRYLIIALPALVMLVAVGITRLPPPAAIALLTAVLLASTAGIAAYRAAPTMEWDAAVAHIQGNGHPDDAVAVWRPNYVKPLAYQVTRLMDAKERPQLALPSVPWDHNPYAGGRVPVTSASERLRGCQYPRIWLVAAPRRVPSEGSADQVVLTTILRDAYVERENIGLGRLRLRLYVRNSEPCPDLS
jgi:hypothetical protein